MADFEELGLKIVVEDYASKQINEINNSILKLNALVKSSSAKTSQKGSSPNTSNLINQQKELNKITKTQGVEYAKVTKDTYALIQAQSKLQKTLPNEVVQKTQNNTTESSNNLEKSQEELNEQTKKNIATTNKNTKRLLKNFSQITLSLLSVRKLTSFLTDAVQASASWTENLNLFAVTFGEDQYRDILEWATDLTSQFGFSNNELVKMTGLYKQLATSLQLTDQIGTSLSQTLTQLTLDFSSYFNSSINTVSAALSSGIFAGQTKSLRYQLGIDISYQTLDNLIKTEETLAKFGVTTRQLTQDQKVLLRSIQVLTAGQNAFGDMAATLDTLQNSFRVLTGSIDNLKLTIGDAFLASPIQKYVDYMTIAVIATEKVIRAFVPLRDELDRTLPSNNILSETSDELDEIQNQMNNFSFDRFESLSSGGEAYSNNDITEALVDLLEEQQKIYDDIFYSTGKVNANVEKASNLAQNFLDWLTKTNLIITETSESGETLFKTTENLFTTIKSLGVISAFVFGGLQAGLTTLILTNEDLRDVTFDLFKTIVEVSPSLTNALIPIVKNFGILFENVIHFISPLLKAVSIVINFINELKLLDEVMVGIITFILAIKSYKLITGLLSLTTSITSLTIASNVLIGVLAFMAFDNVFDGLSKGEKIFAGLTGAILSTLLAYTALSSAFSLGTTIPILAASIGFGLASVKALTSGIKMYENGGMPQSGEVFIANENGNAEMIGNFGGRTAVANNDQIVNGIAKGVGDIIDKKLTPILQYIANKNTNGNVTANVYLDKQSFSKEIYPSIRNEAKRLGDV